MSGMTAGSLILVADDSQHVRDMLKMSLETLGYKVVLAADGESAMERISETRPDLLIVDVMMPKVNGFQICRRVKSDPITREMPVILLTARVQEEDVFWGRDCGADDYITKPFKTMDLQSSIDRLLMRRREERGVGTLDVLDEQRRRLDHGGESQIVMLCWDSAAMDVFRKKYGEIKFSEALQTLRAEAERFLEERCIPGPVGVHVPFGLSAVISGSAPEAIEVAHEMAAHLNDLAAGFYDGDDRIRGHIPLRNRHTGCEDLLPLLSFTARIDPDTLV
jgi:DNA-binding response OmpR family regulator